MEGFQNLNTKQKNYITLTIGIVKLYIVIVDYKLTMMKNKFQSIMLEKILIFSLLKIDLKNYMKKQSEYATKRSQIKDVSKLFLLVNK